MAEGYRLVDQRSKEGIVLEIGAMRENRSTPFLATYCKAEGVEFISVDLDDVMAKGADHIEGCTGVHARGEEFLSDFTRRIGFVYLDNLDWQYENPGDAAMNTFKGQREFYAARGVEMSNLRSQGAHVDQAVHLDRLMPTGVIVIDDTWQRPNGCFDGKGGAAIPFLISRGWKLINEPSVGENLANSFAAVSRGMEE